MSRYPANIITKSPATPTGPNPITGRAPGVWRMEDVAYWLKQGVWPDASADAYWPYTSLLLSSTSLSNANNNLFVDSSGAFNPVSRNGNTTQGSFTPYGSYWSNYFDGSGDYLSAPSNSAFGFGTGAYTVEFWVNFNALGGQELVKTSSGFTAGCWTIWYSGGQVQVVSVGGAGAMTYNWTTATTGQWYHIAVSRDGSSNQALFINGTRVANGTYTNNFAQDGLTVAVGNSASFNGYMSNLRMVKGTAVYDPTQSTITVPTTPLTAISGTSLLTCQSNRFIDNSSNAFALTVNGDTKVQKFSPFTLPYPGAVYNESDITNWSGYFDGSGDYLLSPSNSAFALGTGDYTVECWIYATSAPSDMGIYEGRSGGAASDGFTLTAFSSSVIRIYSGGVLVASSGTNYVGQWTHVAVTRASGTTTLWINGVSQGTSSTSYNCTNTDAVVGGGRYSAGSSVNTYFPGYISNFRIVKGTAVYTGAFTPPTSALTAISGTSLLTCQNAAFTDNSTNNFVITPNGNTTVTGNSPFNTVGYWSNYFDGSTGYLTVNAQTALSYGTGDFTMEAWVYPTAINSGFAPVIEARAGATATTYAFGLRVSGGVYKTEIYIGAQYTGTTTVNLNAWTHIAVSRSSGTLRIFVNGVLDTSWSSVTTSVDANAASQLIGVLRDGAGYYFYGYISNFRAVKGTAVYTGTFTVPAAPLTAVSGTSLLTCQNGRFIDNSTNAFTLTPTGSVSAQSFDPFYTATIASNGGSMYFDGSGDYLQVRRAANLLPGTNDFTLEAWVYPTTTGTTQFIMGFLEQGVSGDWSMFRYTNDTLGIYTQVNGDSFGGVIARNQWNHVALSRVSGTLYKCVNGSATTVSWTGTLNSNLGYNLTIGADNAGDENFFTGWMYGTRIINGTGLYSSTTYTVPTTPFTPTANTSFLLNGMNAGIYDATTINDMETVGNAQVSTVQSKFGGSSVAFDGNGDYLTAPSSPAFAFRTGSFTVETWLNISSYPSGSSPNTYYVLFDNIPIGGSGSRSNAFVWLINSLGQLDTFSSGSFRGTSTSTVPTGQWVHIALVRNGSSSVTYYINGTASGTVTLGTDLTTGGCVISRLGDSPDGYINGYIDDFRITKGVARYTSNFTPPTAAFPVY